MIKFEGCQKNKLKKSLYLQGFFFLLILTVLMVVVDFVISLVEGCRNVFVVLFTVYLTLVMALFSKLVRSISFMGVEQGLVQ